MSHDFAKGKKKSSGSKKRPAKGKNASKQTEKSGLPSWVVFCSGVALTLFVQFLYHLAQVDTSELTPEAVQQHIEEVTDKPLYQKPILNFYNDLKNMEVKVDDDEVAEREQETYNYALQAGSFKNRDDANQQRAEIMLMGLDAKIESRTSESGTEWHRIIVGPFTSRSDLAKARSTLINNDVPTMKIKRSN